MANKTTGFTARKNVRGLRSVGTQGADLADIHQDLAGFLPAINQFVTQYQTQGSGYAMNTGMGVQNPYQIIIAWTGWLLSQGFLELPTATRVRRTG